MKIMELNSYNFKWIEQNFERMSNDPYALGYGNAMNFYRAQKENMQKRLTLALEKLISKESIKTADEMSADLLNDMLTTNTKDTKVQQNAAEQVLRNIDNMFDKNNIISDSVAETLRKQLETIVKEMGKYHREKHPYKDFRETYFNKVREFLREQAESASTELGESMQKLKKLKQGNNSTVYSQYLSYFTLQIINRYGPLKGRGKIVKSKNAYVNALKGYYREEAVEKAFNSLFKDLYKQCNVPPNKRKKVVSNIGGKQEIVDLDIGIDVLEQIASLNGKTYEGTAQISEKDITIPADIRNERYGAQVKSFVLKDKGGKVKDFFSLGGNATLRSELVSYGKVGQTMLGNMLFMGEIKSIKEALGADNVMFIDGQNKYWMYDFIKEFRTQGLWLSLSARGQDWAREVTDKIVLYSYKKSRYKT